MAGSAAVHPCGHPDWRVPGAYNPAVLVETGDTFEPLARRRASEAARV
jgi:hypothetical protein